MTPLTSRLPVSKEHSSFNGSVLWKGFSEKLYIEISGGAPLVHRRIVFTTPGALRVSGLLPLDGVGGRRAGDGDEYGRISAFDISDSNAVLWLTALFDDPSNIGAIQCRMKREGFTVLEDRRFLHSGKDSGTIKEKRFYNKIGKKMIYAPVPGGSEVFGDGAALHSPLQNLYILDVFQYGLQARSGGTSKLKREHSGDSYDFAMDEDEDAVPGRKSVRITSDMSIYYYPPS